ncbi:MAG: hypothetical protein ACI9J4_000427 [Paraglaciecola sp.]|jgi:hypothetical protein
MDTQGFTSQILEKKNDILDLGLSLLFFIICIIHVVLIILRQHIEQMWMVFGTIAIMLLLLNAPKNILSIFVIIIFGTFVADEEFLLEVAAVTKGEQLSTIRESRNFEVLTVTSEKDTELVLTEKLETLLNSGKKPQEIIHALEIYRIELEIKEDLPGFDPIDKDVIIAFATKGALDESVFFQLMQDKGYTVNNIANTFEKLGAAEYLSNKPNNVNVAQLTAQGVALAKELGVTALIN